MSFNLRLACVFNETKAHYLVINLLSSSRVVFFRNVTVRKPGMCKLRCICIFSTQYGFLIDKYCVIPANTRRRSPKVDSMLAHRLRRSPNIEPNLGERLVFAGLVHWADKTLFSSFKAYAFLSLDLVSIN